MKRPFALLVAVLLPAAAYGAGSPAKSNEMPVNTSLAAGKVHEECLRLEAGERRRYHWKSAEAVDFNIHYHVGDQVHYPVKRERMRGDGGTFTAKIAQDYCWMWTAKKTTRIEGAITP